MHVQLARRRALRALRSAGGGAAARAQLHVGAADLGAEPRQRGGVELMELGDDFDDFDFYVFFR